MIKVNVQAPEKRDRAGFVAIVDGLQTLAEGAAVATSGVADPKRTQGDHPPFGRYELTARAPTPGGAETEYGPELLLFEPIAGPALEAESRGRFGVLLYAGSAGRDTFLRRTQGGVRLSRRAMEILLAHARDDVDVELRIEALTPTPWWAFWRKRATPPSLSRDPPRLTAPPFDEATLAAQMLKSAIRRERAPRRDEDRDRWRDRDSSADTSRGSSGEYRGGGGTGGGGGATGTWTDTPPAGRGPGVSAAGVIAGAAGVAAIAAAAAERDSAASTSIDAGSSSFHDSGGERESASGTSADAGVSSAHDSGAERESASGTSGDAGSSSFHDSGSADADSGSSSTTTSTAY